jgi:hypothetical protein
VPVTREKSRFPDLSHVPEFPPAVAVSGGEIISTPSPRRPQGSRLIYFVHFLDPQSYPQKMVSYPHLAAVIHHLFTTHPQVTGCDSGATTMVFYLPYPVITPALS